MQEIIHVSEDAKYNSAFLFGFLHRISGGHMRELLAPVDEIQEELNKTTKLNQCSHCQESPNEDVHPMEEVSAVQPAYGLTGKQE